MTSTPADRSAPDDLSTYRHRQVIGALGALLPLLVWLIAGLRPADDVSSPWHVLTSISGYYHTTGVVAFVGVLVALSIYLLTYAGFANKDGRLDRITARVAGVAAALVALFPTRTAAQPGPHWLKPWVWWTHYGSAAVVFTCFMFFSLVLFTKTTDPNPDAGKRLRNAIYRTCGWAILACLVWIVIASIRDWPIFLPEALALEFFALSWLTKGRADHAVAGIKDKAVRIVHGLRSGDRPMSEPR